MNSHGEIVGINTAIIANAQGIGFAVSAATAAWVLPQLFQHGQVARAYLGIVGRQRPLGRRTVRFHELAADHAVEVTSLDPAGPAARAGLQRGDLIVSINGQPVRVAAGGGTVIDPGAPRDESDTERLANQGIEDQIPSPAIGC
jgi:S1-C subfamily serine protease